MRLKGQFYRINGRVNAAAGATQAQTLIVPKPGIIVRVMFGVLIDATTNAAKATVYLTRRGSEAIYTGNMQADDSMIAVAIVGNDSGVAGCQRGFTGQQEVFEPVQGGQPLALVIVTGVGLNAAYVEFSALVRA